MLLPRILQYGWLVTIAAHAQSADNTISILSSLATGLSKATLPTGSYISYSSTVTVSSSSRPAGLLGSMTNGASIMGSDNTTLSATTSETPSQTLLSGSNTPTTTGSTSGIASSNATGSSTSSSAQPTNTTPCNTHAEFCSRKYSNITMVCAHNSPFNRPNNAASNQALAVTTQLDDGIRMLQAQSHVVNGTIYLCHTSCDILNAGTLTSYLATVNTWVQTHPYDVITILIENGDYVPVTTYQFPIEASGITQYVYIPPKIPMSLDDWPTLASMILNGQRVVLFMDYQANQTAIPWILDEFSQLWETPFDPTNRSFPCNVQRPPNLQADEAKSRMYMTNHNLNTEITLLGNTVSVPTIPLLDVTNNVTGNGSLGDGAETCYDDWGRPPNFLNVDYYNVGNGSVFEVAAKWNMVNYTRTCCGLATSGAERMRDRSAVLLAFVVILTGWFLLCWF